MRKNTLKLSRIPIIFSLILAYAITGQQADSPNEVESEFVARLIATTPELDRKFKARLDESFMPLWQKLKEDKIISSVSLFKVNHEKYSKLYSNDWLYLLLIGLDEQAAAEQLLDVEKKAKCFRSTDSEVFQVLRTESMKCTQNSCYGFPNLSYKDAPDGISYLIEFIGTVDSPDSLMKYRQLMSEYFGPANGMLRSKGVLHCFNALETKTILYEAPGVVHWNQIHISDHWDESPSTNWDSVYVELFREELSTDLDSVWSELPTMVDGANCRGHLVPNVYLR